jgi:hypothetical protein
MIQPIFCNENIFTACVLIDGVFSKRWTFLDLWIKNNRHGIYDMGVFFEMRHLSWSQKQPPKKNCNARIPSHSSLNPNPFFMGLYNKASLVKSPSLHRIEIEGGWMALKQHIFRIFSPKFSPKVAPHQLAVAAFTEYQRAPHQG